MPYTIYIPIVLIAVFTGWFITWLLIKLLFHPRKPVRVAGFTLQGIFPQQQPVLAQKLGHAAATQLLSADALEQKITNPQSFQQLKPVIENHVDHFLNHKLKEVFPMLSMLIGEKTINQLKGAFLGELENLFPVIMKNYLGKLQQDLALEQMVQDKIMGLSAEKLEAMLYQHAGKQLTMLQLAGAAIGLAAGLLQVLVLQLAV
ncbi:MAG: hypothetical protein RL172_979 [Bacteroidota bacterium]|jgi:uncharacterized membrane protein YheB (UPF0754 family)